MQADLVSHHSARTGVIIIWGDAGSNWNGCSCGCSRLTFCKGEEELDWIEQIWLIGEVALAALLGGLIGFEREIADRPAGLRTHMLVASAAALFVGLTDSFLGVYTGLGYSEFMSIDPIRVTQAIVTGVAFLGAGTIFRGGRDNYIQELTTAASILLVSGIGMAVSLN